MAAHVYRYLSTGLPPLTTLQRMVGGAAIAVSAIGPNIYVDITADDTQLADLSQIMLALGFGALVAIDPTNTPAQQAALINPETADLLILPEGRVTGNGTRVAQTTYEGASLFLRKPVTFGHILFRLTALTGAPTTTVNVLVYQQANGLSGIASLKATINLFAPAASGNQSVAPSEGTVTLQPGLVYVLYGRSSVGGSATLRT